MFPSNHVHLDPKLLVLPTGVLQQKSMSVFITVIGDPKLWFSPLENLTPPLENNLTDTWEITPETLKKRRYVINETIVQNMLFDT